MRERRWRPVSPSCMKDPLNHVTTITYNAFGQPTSVQGPIASEPPTTFVYDANGNLITTTDPLGNATQRAYDQVSRLVNLTDPRQLQTQFRYDGLNRVTEIADARQGITRFGYDQNGNLLSVQDAKAQPTTYTYDSMDQLFTRKDALNRQEGYQYDPFGNLTQFTDRKTQQSTFGYDNLNRRISASYADSSSTTFTYDAVGRLTRATDNALGAGTIDFFYDTLDRLILEVTPQGAVAYEYDAIGRRTKMTVAGKAPVTYQYDAASRLTQVVQGSLVVGIGYDAAGRRTSLTYPNGTNTSYTYDNASRLTRILHQGPGATTIEDLTYTYDAAGNRTSLTRTNDTASLLPAAVTSATYDAANEQTQFAGATLTYDQNGNLISDVINTYTWDVRDRLVGISGGTIASFLYDPYDRRVSRTINGSVSTYLYDASDIIQELGSGAMGATYLRSLDVDEPFVRQTANGDEYYHADAIGSIQATTNDSGSAASTYSYEVFGKTVINAPSTNPVQFTGRENDGTGLYYYRARYYSPSLHRFIGEDPEDLVGDDINPYAYALNSPVNFTDPSGEIVPLVPLIGFCIRGGLQSIGLDILSGRKATLGSFASGCFSGGLNKFKVVSRATGGGGFPKGPTPPKNWKPPTNPPQPPPPIPPGHISGPSRSGGGTVYQAPGSTGDANSVRVMPPGAHPNYTNGYWVQTNEKGHAINPATGKTGPPQDTHVPLPPGYFNRP